MISSSWQRRTAPNETGRRSVRRCSSASMRSSGGPAATQSEPCTVWMTGWRRNSHAVEQGRSGKVGARQRPLFEQMKRDAAARKFDWLLVWKVSRLGRDMREVIATVYDL